MYEYKSQYAPSGRLAASCSFPELYFLISHIFFGSLSSGPLLLVIFHFYICYIF